MSALTTLRAQAEHHFRWLSRAVADVGEEHARFELAAGRPSIAWLTGHLTVGADSIGQAVAGLPPGLPTGFEARHGEPHWGVGRAGWRELTAEWERARERASGGLEQLGEADLQLAPSIEILPEFAERLATRGAFLAGELFHFAYHLGQIGSLRAAQGLGWA